MAIELRRRGGRLGSAGMLVATCAVCTLRLAPQMGESPDGWLGLPGGMEQASGVALQRQDTVEESRNSVTAATAMATATPGVEGNAGVWVKYPTPSAPFSREQTFFVLVGAVTTAAGSFAYWIIRTGRHRRHGPTGFVTEAVLVVDLVESTHLATHYGDGLAMQARTILKDRTLAATKGHGLAFVENIGDGYFMTFPAVVNAVQVAVTLLKELREKPPDLSPTRSLDVRVGISFGEILLDARGTRHGTVINRAFRLEGLTREGFAQVDGAPQHEGIPDRNRIFLDEEAAQELRTSEIPLRFLGFYSLKGFSGLHQVHEVLWARSG